MERAYFCTEHSSFGGPKRCQVGAQIAPDVCEMESGWFIPDESQIEAKAREMFQNDFTLADWEYADQEHYRELARAEAPTPSPLTEALERKVWWKASEGRIEIAEAEFDVIVAAARKWEAFPTDAQLEAAARRIYSVKWGPSMSGSKPGSQEYEMARAAFEAVKGDTE